MYEKGKWYPMTKRNFEKFFKAHLDCLGLNSKLLTPCSFRKGGLCHMLLNVANLELLRLQGDWWSDSYKRYIVIPAVQRFSVTEKVLENICRVLNNILHHFLKYSMYGLTVFTLMKLTL